MLDIVLSKPQMKFVNEDAPLSIALCGRGSGKTFCGSVWVIKTAATHPGSLGLIAASNPAQLNTVAVSQLTELLDQLNIPWVKGEEPPWGTRFTNHTNVLSIANGSQVLLRSFHESGADRNLRGLTLNYAWLDESRELQSGVFDTILACMRSKEGPNSIRLTSTPNGKDWQYRKFIDPDKKLKGSTCHRWTTYENKHLPAEFAIDLKSNLDTETYNQEVMGEICSFGSNMVFRFDKEKHVKPSCFMQGYPLYYSTDLNVNNYSGVICQFCEKQKLLWVIDEIYFRTGGNTQRACEEVLLRHRDKFPLVPEFCYLCDEAGAAKSTRVAYNDIEIMQKAFKQIPNSRCLNGSKKPGVVESVTAFNGMLDPADGTQHFYVDPKCKNLIRDLESLKWLPEEPRRIDKSDPELSHGADSARYLTWILVQKQQTPRSFNLQEIRQINPNFYR